MQLREGWLVEKVRARVRVIAIRKNSQRFIAEELSPCVPRDCTGYVHPRVVPDLHPPVRVCWHGASTGELTRSASQLMGLEKGGGRGSPGWRRVYLRTINRRRVLLLFSAESGFFLVLSWMWTIRVNALSNLPDYPLDQPGKLLDGSNLRAWIDLGAIFSRVLWTFGSLAANDRTGDLFKVDGDMAQFVQGRATRKDNYVFRSEYQRRASISLDTRNRVSGYISLLIPIVLYTYRESSCRLWTANLLDTLPDEDDKFIRIE